MIWWLVFRDIVKELWAALTRKRGADQVDE